jgi:hypothetical protein
MLRNTSLWVIKTYDRAEGYSDLRFVGADCASVSGASTAFAPETDWPSLEPNVQVNLSHTV